MNKAIVIIGPQGSGKTQKMKEITAGHKTVIQNDPYSFEMTPFEHIPKYYVLNNLGDISSGFSVFILKKLLEPKSFRHINGEVKPAPILIIISQNKLSDMPSFFFREEIELIDLNPQHA